MIDQAQLDRGIEAAKGYTDVKVAGLGGRIDVVDARLKAVDDRLSLMSAVPTDVAALKVSVSTLPDKDYIRDGFRHQLVAIGIMVSIIGTIVGAVTGIVLHFVH